MTENTKTATVAANAADVGQEAKAQAADVAHEAANQLQGAWHDLRRDLRVQATQQTERAGGGLRQLDNQLQALRRGDVEAAGPVADYAEQLQAKVHQLAQRVQDEGFDGVVADLRTFARRRPGLFLVSAAAAGFFAGRLARGAVASAHEQGPGASNGAATMPRAASAPIAVGSSVPTGTVPIGMEPVAAVDPLGRVEPVVTPTALDDPYPTTGMTS